MPSSESSGRSGVADTGSTPASRRASKYGRDFSSYRKGTATRSTNGPLIHAADFQGFVDDGEQLRAGDFDLLGFVGHVFGGQRPTGLVAIARAVHAVASTGVEELLDLDARQWARSAQHLRGERDAREVLDDIHAVER